MLVLALALLGRASLPDNLREEHMSLEYDDALDTLSVARFILRHRQDDIQHHSSGVDFVDSILYCNTVQVCPDILSSCQKLQPYASCEKPQELLIWQRVLYLEVSFPRMPPLISF